jgi:integrase/recombinase XerD
MLIPYRRHSEKCPHEPKGRAHRACKCPIWADGVLGIREVRISLKTRDWNEAARKILRMQAEGRTGGPVLLSVAWESFIADLEARQVSAGTVKKYKLLRDRLESYVTARKLINVSDCTLDVLTRFRETWKDGPRTAAKRLERLRAFFRFSTERHWSETNPALSLKAPRITLRPTMPLTHDEMLKLLTACEKYEAEIQSLGYRNAQRLKTLVLLMRYSGMRISDAVRLTKDRVNGDRLFLYTQKTGVPVYSVLPKFVAEALEKTPPVNEKFFFWSGNGQLETAVKDWQGRLRKLFDLAGVAKGDGFMVSHRFRDTFSVELLLAGVPIERVSVLLGHSSVRITEKHYNPWVRSRQEQLEADVRNAWRHDPMQEGTKRVQRQNTRPN